MISEAVASVTFQGMDFGWRVMVVARFEVRRWVARRRVGRRGRGVVESTREIGPGGLVWRFW